MDTYGKTVGVALHRAADGISEDRGDTWTGPRAAPPSDEHDSVRYCDEPTISPETTALVWVLVGLSVPKCPAADAEKKAAANVFGTTKVWKVDLEIPAKEYEAMQPPAGGFGLPARTARTARSQR